MIRFSRVLFTAAAASNIAFSRALTTNALTFSEPVPFQEALDALHVKSVLPTTLSSAELAEIDVAIRERALFSARMASAEVLQELGNILEEYSQGRIGLGQARDQLRAAMKENGIFAEYDDAGTIKDFQSVPRLNLILQTNAQMAAGYGNWIYRQQPAILDEWPAQELYRAAPAKAPRNWHARWLDAGGKLIGGRMVALVNDGIWKKISRFGQPYPPFDFGSHMRLLAVNRDDAISLKLIDRDTQIAPESRGFNEDLKVTSDVRDAALRRVLEDDGYTFDGDVLTL